MEVFFDGPIQGSTGYSKASRNYLLSLDDIGVKVCTKNQEDPFDGLDGGLPWELIEKLSMFPINEVAKDAPFIQFHTAEKELIKNNLSRKNICFVSSDVNTITPYMVKKYNLFDIVLVPSDFNANLFSRNGVDKEKLAVIPYIVDTNIFKPDTESFRLNYKKGFNFLSVFEFSYRKGWDILLEAFWKEFNDEEDVSLTLKTYFQKPSLLRDKWLRLQLKKYQARKGFLSNKNVFLFTESLSDLNMARFYKTFDCMVSPSRGERFGLSIAEAMSCGLPVIVTNWGGHLDFCNESNSYLININNYQKYNEEIDPFVLHKDYEWPQPDVKHLRKLMRYVYENYQEAKEKALCGTETIKRNYSFSVIGEKIRNVLIP